MSQPVAGVLKAFSISGPLEPLPGGRGLCFQAHGIVLKPADDDNEAQWIAQTISALRESCPTTVYRLPRPIPDANLPTSFVHDGWIAWSFLPGRATSPVRFQDVLRVCHAFHRDIATLQLARPTFLDHLTDRFHEADRVAWDEKDLDAASNVNAEVLARIHPALMELGQLKVRLPDDCPFQIIHGDITGNMLFHDNPDVPPGIIDMTPFWRPAAYAEAIVVADGLAWHGQGRELIESFGTDSFRLQLLVRALYWRCLTFAIDSDMAFVQAHLPKVDFHDAARMVRGAIQGARRRG